MENSKGFEKVLSQYFKGSLLTFIRQLHFYGFRKVDIKGDKWSFSHKCFRKEMPHLIYEIKRKTRTETNDGVASQLEVQALRDHVGKLHETLKAVQSELRETREEIAVLRHAMKRDSSSFMNNFYDSGFISNGADVVQKKRKVLSSEDSDQVKQEAAASDSERNSLSSYGMDPLSTFLPFTDDTLEALGSNGDVLV